MATGHLTKSLIKKAGIAEIVSYDSRLRSWLEVEGLLAEAQADAGIIPAAAAIAIRAAINDERVDLELAAADTRQTCHSLFPLIAELGKAAGEIGSPWVHFGATTQNITQTGDLLILKRVHGLVRFYLSNLLQAAADQAEKHAETLTAGRTHGQHAVPTTFGFKVATWIDELLRHCERLEELNKRLFRVSMAGAIGTYGVFPITPEVEADVAKRAGINGSKLSSRNALDAICEHTLICGLLASSLSRFAREIYNLSRTEIGEVSEPIPHSAIGSSTMPQKQNPQLCQDIIALSARMRAEVMVSLESLNIDHEGDAQSSTCMEAALNSSLIIEDMLARSIALVGDIKVNSQAMISNLAISDGSICAENLLFAMAPLIGRHEAHAIISDVCFRSRNEHRPFRELVFEDRQIAELLSTTDIDRSLTEKDAIGDSVAVSLRMAEEARKTARGLKCDDDRRRGAETLRPENFPNGVVSNVC